jgi:sucrose-6-phosphate hydrolase SacC (GH32 family)
MFNGTAAAGKCLLRAPDTQGTQHQHWLSYSEDGITWTKYEGNPVIDLETLQAFFPSFIVKDGAYLVYYATTPGVAYTEFHVAAGTISLDQ